MGYTTNEILRACNECNIHNKINNADYTDKIIQDIKAIYCNNTTSELLWDHFNIKCLLYNDNNNKAWMWMNDLIGDYETIMLIFDNDCPHSLLFKNGFDIQKILGETFLFEFYLTNIKLSYLLCLSHHDILYACGNIIDKLKSYLDSIDEIYSIRPY